MADDVAEVATKEITKELGFTTWLTKIVERGNIVLDCMKSRVDIKQEDDWAIIEMFHKNWFFGEHILYETITVPDLSKSVTQASLFDDKSVNTTDIPTGAHNKTADGKVLADTTPKPKKSKK
jgi:hypothetical protein